MIRTTSLPALPAAKLTQLLYVLAGQVAVDDETLDAGDSLLIEAPPQRIVATATADLALFSTDEAAPVFKGGMFSGNLNA